MSDPISKKIIWLRPDPRCVIDINAYHLPRSLAKIIRQKRFSTTINQDFKSVVTVCSSRQQSWITPELIEIYYQLYNQKKALSVETWYQGELVGGVFGLCFSKAFFAKSMFFYLSNASKVALICLLEYLKSQNFVLFDCQYMSAHLKQFAAYEISDSNYNKILQESQKDFLLL
jgi:leucyl/phenylalanyl-tRNA---protein transferase